MDKSKVAHFPYEIKEIDPKKADEHRKFFTGELGGHVSVGPKGYFLSAPYKDMAADIYNMDVRPSDVFVVTSPRSGTTCMQELVWLVANDLDFDTAAREMLSSRFPFLESAMLFDPITINKLMEENEKVKQNIDVIRAGIMPVAQILNSGPSRRFIKSHLPLSLLPPKLLDTAKTIYLARDPRDLAISLYHHNRLLTIHGFNGDFKTYWKLFVENMILYCPLIECMKEAWNQRNHPNMLFLFYEDIVNDLRGVINRVAKFLNKPLTEQQVDKLCQHLQIDQFRNNSSVNLDIIKELGIQKDGEQPFIRKGKSGGWQDYFDEEMLQQAESWIAENLRDTDMRFPKYTNK